MHEGPSGGGPRDRGAPVIPPPPCTPFRKSPVGDAARRGFADAAAPKRPPAQHLPQDVVAHTLPRRAWPGSLADLASPSPMAHATPTPGEHSDPWMSIAKPSRMMVCPAGHPLQEVSLLCDLCHGKLSDAASSTSPVCYCHACRQIVCCACWGSLEGGCLKQHPESVSYLQLKCDACGYRAPFETNMRRDPTTGEFVAEAEFEQRVGAAGVQATWEEAEMQVHRTRRFYGCIRCNYDICDRCSQSRRARKGVSGSVVVRGRRVHILSFQLEASLSHKAAVAYLVAQARLAIPAVLNFLYLRRTTKRACLYFGRYDQFGNTVGIPDVVVGVAQGRLKTPITAAHELRREFLKIMMKELWPPLNVDTVSDAESSPKTLKFVLSSNMQALLWVKRVPLPCGGTPPLGEGRVYVKLILQNVPHIYFDNVHPGQEKHRWTNRQLHVRRLDNLETEKAVTSFEAFQAALRNACAWARAWYSKHGTMPPVEVCMPLAADGTEFRYTYGQRLFDDEDSLLDYKSYWVDPVAELLHNAPKFMAGFANAYGGGRLLVGVMEVNRWEVTAHPREGRPRVDALDTYAPAEWARQSGIEDKAALVMGVSLSRRDLATLSRGLTQAFQKCIPPIPTEWVKVDLHPVRRPEPWVAADGSCVVLVFHVDGNFRSDAVVNTFRSLAHRALRVLLGYGLALVQLNGTQSIPSWRPPDPPTPGQSSLLFAVVRGCAAQGAARCDAQQATQFHFSRPAEGLNAAAQPDWRVDLAKNMIPAHCAIHDVPTVPTLPPLYVLEVSVERDNAVLPRPAGKAGATPPMFFTGWPSIPIWDEINDEVRHVSKDLKLFERRRERPKAKHWLSDFTLLQRVCACLRPADSLCLAQAQRAQWAEVIRLREVSRAFFAAVMGECGLSAFEWPSRDNVERLPVPLQTLRRCVSMPPIWRLFMSIAGDLAMPYPYTAVPPAFGTAAFELHCHTAQPVLVAPFLREMQDNGIDERLAAVICVRTSRLMLLHPVEGPVPVTGMVIRPVLTQGARHPQQRSVGGFELIHTPGRRAWDLPAFMRWYQMVSSDPCVPLSKVDACRALSLNAEPSSESDSDFAPRLCARHIPPGSDDVQLVEASSCDWHDLEDKWARNQGKHWRD